MKVRIYLLIVLATVLSLVVSKPVLAQNASVTVDATVKISICGNGIVEGGEDCEGQNLNNKSCTDLGFASGHLTCDISCSYDATSCSQPFSTPSPTPFPTAAPFNATPLTSEVFPTAAPTPSESSPLIAVIRPNTPASVRQLDPNNDGRIARNELYDTINLWVREWRRFLSILEARSGSIEEVEGNRICDINSDRYCDLTDLSVVLYYIE